FDLGLYRSGASREKKFEEPGLVRVYCNIHPQMVGFVMIVDSDFAAVTGPDGSFRFEGVPPGSHVVRVWHEEAGETPPAEARAGATPPPTIGGDATTSRPFPPKNKTGKDYPRGAGTDEARSGAAPAAGRAGGRAAAEGRPETSSAGPAAVLPAVQDLS